MLVHGSHRESVHVCLQQHSAVVSVQISNSLNQLKLHFVGCLQQKRFDFFFMTKQIASLSVLNKFGSFCESDE